MWTAIKSAGNDEDGHMRFRQNYEFRSERRSNSLLNNCSLRNQVKEHMVCLPFFDNGEFVLIALHPETGPCDARKLENVVANLSCAVTDELCLLYQ